MMESETCFICQANDAVPEKPAIVRLKRLVGKSGNQMVTEHIEIHVPACAQCLAAEESLHGRKLNISLACLFGCTAIGFALGESVLGGVAGLVLCIYSFSSVGFNRRILQYPEIMALRKDITAAWHE